MNGYLIFVLLLICISVNGKTFTYLNYNEIEAEITALANSYPDIIELTTAQNAFGLAHPGNCGNNKCVQHIVRLGLRSAHDQFTPEMFVSGCLHGNERVGPTISVEFLIFMAESYYGINAYPNNPWIKYLMEHRSIYVMPMTNSLGYYKNTRQENIYDPNRDFAFDVPNGSCMNTITARSVNELWRRHLFQIAVTFHAGIHMITLEWGSYSHYKDRKSTIPPDDVAQMALGSVMSSAAGAFPNYYPHGRSNDILYPVHGGMEDWGYAGSWEQLPNGCNTKTFGGYSRKRTKYSSAMLRAFNVLVETSQSKVPPESSLGGDDEILNPSGDGDGHVPRNIRLLLATADLLQPYIRVVDPTGVAPNSCKDNIYSLTLPGHDNELPTIRFAENEVPAFAVGWEVGGSTIVDSTFLIWGKWPTKRKFKAFKSGFGLSARSSYKTFKRYFPQGNGCVLCGHTTEQSGFTRWSGGGMAGTGKGDNQLLYGSRTSFDAELKDRQANPYIPAFVDCAQVPQMKGSYFVMAVAAVDSDWGEQPDAPDPAIPPQSHLVNARTNTKWKKRIGKHRIIGQKYWFSKPIKVVVEFAD